MEVIHVEIVMDENDEHQEKIEFLMKVIEVVIIMNENDEHPQTKNFQ
jgi:hypothetical protein